MARQQKSVAVQALQERWLRMVGEYGRARRSALQSGAGPDELARVDLRYALLIDLAYTELKSAESLDKLRVFLAGGDS